MKRIVLVTTSFPRSIAGSESAGSFVEDFSVALARHCRLSVVAPGLADGHEQGDGYGIYRYWSPERPLSQLKLWAPGDALAIAKVLKHGAAVTAQAVAAEKADFVFALWALPSGWWARRSGVPYACWCLGSDIWSLGRVPLVRSVLRSVLRDAAQVYADGYELGEAVSRLAGIDCGFLPSSRALPLENRTAPRAAAPYRLLFIGRWHPNKGTDLLLDALGMLDDSDWNLIEDLRIYGGGPLENLVRAKTAELQAAGRPVQAFGYIDKPGAAQALQDSDWLLIPSRIESIPVVFSDAMQAQRPVVSMPVGDLAKLIREGEVGIAAAGVSAPDFAEAIRAALRQGTAGYREGLMKTAETFEVASSAKRLLRMLEK